MDYEILAEHLASVLPVLARVGQSVLDPAAEAAGQRLGDSAIEGLRNMWQRLSSTLRRKAVEVPSPDQLGQLAEPERAALVRALEELLRAQPDMANATRELFRNHPELSARRWQALSTPAGNSVIVEGDRNVVQSGAHNTNISAGGDMSIDGAFEAGSK